jgi:uncharacterized protein YdhG (YjbR/CyaY superfamily)
MTSDVDKYLAKVPEPARTTLTRLRELIRSVVPPETIEVLSYRIPTFRYKGGLVAYAAFKNHCSFFPMSSTLLGEFPKDVAKYRSSKGTLQFPLDKPLPAALVKKLVKARIEEQDAKARIKRLRG